jgi:uncharacterized protein YbcI
MMRAIMKNTTAESKLTMSQRVAHAASQFQQQQTGHAPKGATAVLSEDTLVVMLHEALTPAERALAQNAAGAAQVQDFHRRLFQSSVDVLRQEIKRITGVAVREAAVEVETSTGAVVQVCTTGTMVQVFQLARAISVQAWNASEPVEPT